ncbi:hypothetical protein [Curtobacterium herbarum]|uniref:hypothetical protein n=1 Tax=Curtobacterium herbarum TaxID=150122 RepID=UPI001956ED34|nr:hypothetical protein [Curtobacterium herbarum]MBM7475656.1 hypothetical protein [Curtobacterium herbarum]
MTVLRLRWVVASALVSVGLAAVSPTFALPVPSLSGANPFAGVRSFALLAVLLTILTWSATALGTRPASLVSVRRVATPAALPAVALLTVTFGAGVLQIVDPDAATPAWLLVRDTLGLSALSVLLLRWTGFRYAGVVPTVALFVSAVFGRDTTAATERATWWAWPVADSTSLEYWCAPVVLGVVALLVMVVRSPAPITALVRQTTVPARSGQ